MSRRLFALPALVLVGASMLGSGAVGSGSAQSNEEPTVASPGAPDMTVYWANEALVHGRYCRRLAELSARVVRACSCSTEEITEHFLSEEELFASCTYHLVGRIPEDRAVHVNEQALGRCMRRVEASLTGCTRTRLPQTCELDRIFTGLADTVELSRPAGTYCRATNGDEDFDAHFACAAGLTCAGTCGPSAPHAITACWTEDDCRPDERCRGAVAASGTASGRAGRCERDPCRNPLDLPGALP